MRTRSSALPDLPAPKYPPVSAGHWADILRISEQTLERRHVRSTVVPTSLQSGPGAWISYGASNDSDNDNIDNCEQLQVSTHPSLCRCIVDHES